MVEIRTAEHTAVINNIAMHRIYVEGCGEDSIDPVVLKGLLTIDVIPLGSSYHIESAAQALYKDHPHYYFLIDRDHHSSALVEASWSNFPDPAKSNLLIWRRREIENYFLIPEYVEQSKDLKVSKKKLRNEILRLCMERLYLDVVNKVIIDMRENMKENWISIFSSIDGFDSKDKALQKLLSIEGFKGYEKKVNEAISQESLNEAFEKCLNEFTGGENTLVYEKGLWLSMIRGKPVFNSIAETCFKVRDKKGKDVQGKVKMNGIVKGLLSDGNIKQPDDFIQLKKLINEKILKKHSRA